MGSNLFAGTDLGVFLSTDNGSSWTEDNSGLMPNYSYVSFAINGTSLFVGSPIGGIFRSENSGTSWTDVTTIDIDDFLIKELWAGGGTIFAGTYAGSVYRSANNGESWTAANSGMPQTTINAFMINDGAVFAATDTGLFISTNNGTSWTGPNSEFPADTRVRSFAKSGAKVYAGTKHGVFLSTNNGASWTAINSGLGDSNIVSLTTSGTNLFAGTLDGMIWRLPLEDAFLHPQQLIPGERCSFKLIMPDRHCAEAIVRFSLQQEDRIDISVFDILGHRISSLVRGRMGAGTHNVPWDMRNLSPGIYVVKMKTGSGVQSRNIPLFR